MQHTGPPDSMAPHIPADTYRRAQETGQPIILMYPAPAPPRRTARTYLIGVAVITAAGVGGMGLVVAFIALLDVAAHTAMAIGGAAGPIGVGGITLRLARAKT